MCANIHTIFDKNKFLLKKLSFARLVNHGNNLILATLVKHPSKMLAIHN